MRRFLLLIVLLSAASLVALKVRERTAPALAGEPPTWPPITPRPDPTPPRVDERVEERVEAVVTWKPVNDDGTMPDGYPIKAKSQSMIFHMPSGRFYDRTKPERCYATEAAAVADGYRRSKA